MTLKNKVLDEINIQLEQQQGATTITVNLNPLLKPIVKPYLPPYLGSPTDLYWAFRGTQGVMTYGNGTVNGDSYSGKLTYIILDTYGFSVRDACSLPFGAGAAMRYLQVNCGNTSLGARWFPDAIILTQSFSETL